jgi:KUP system potassium uptake protein
VVYGDIGTSPLYAIKECFAPQYGITPTTENVLGLLSLVFWALTLTVTLKYLVFILRADNHGEGGIMALLALLIPKLAKPGVERAGDDQEHPSRRFILITLGLFGAALLFGDGVITPAISVLSAVEGLQVATPAFHPVIVPLTVIILILLFMMQSRGTTSIGNVFGPTMLIYFACIVAMGVPWIMKHPVVLLAVSPAHAVRFFFENGIHSFFVLTGVVLCITGGEALYADMGHFGKTPIRIGWFSIVFPALLVNYFGQGAYIIEHGKEALENPFFGMVSGPLLYPLVLVSTVATVIASQALISGVYSLSQQAIQLGYFPRMTITHTSRDEEGQIYMPTPNWLLMLACVALVIYFGESSKLAAAYGVAVTGTMTITSLLFFAITRNIWKWPLALSLLLVSAFLVVDVTFLGSNLTKIHEGGWIPLVAAALVFSVMTTWKKGRTILSEHMRKLSVPLDEFIDQVARKHPHRVRGTAVFMTLTRDIAPSVLLHHYKHNQVLHEHVVLLSILTKNEPEVDSVERVRVTEYPEGFFKVVAHYGYMERPDISEILELCEGGGMTVDYKNISFYLGRETFVTSGESRLARWRKRLFVFLSRNARPATDFFGIPPNQVIEIGSQFKI